LNAKLESEQNLVAQLQKKIKELQVTSRRHYELFFFIIARYKYFYVLTDLLTYLPSGSIDNVLISERCYSRYTFVNG